MDGSRDFVYERFEEGRWHAVEGAVVREARVRLHVNGRELASLMCTPCDLDLLALGFLRSERIIGSIDDVRLLRVCPSGTCVEIWLRNADFEPPTALTITSGCGGGVTFADLSTAAEPVASGLRVSTGQIQGLMQALQQAGTLYRQARGVHAAGLAEASHDGPAQLVFVAEDVGRHNAVDKVWGHCLARGLPTHDRILLTTGRISSEMLFKAASMGVPVVASRTSPTSLSVELAISWHLTLVGYVRRDSMNVYSGRERVVTPREEGIHAQS